MNSKLKLEFDNMTCMIKMANCDSTKGKITLGDFRENLHNKEALEMELMLTKFSSYQSRKKINFHRIFTDVLRFVTQIDGCS